MTLTEHALTTTVLQLPDGSGWRIVATCSCLGFGRKATTSTQSIAEHGRLMAADYHREHVRRCRAGAEVPEGRPSWLPPL